MKLASSLLLISLLLSPLSQASDKNSQPIKIILNNWSSQIVLSRITGNILENQGYMVKYKKIHTKGQWFALTEGLAHVQMEAWQGTMADKFAQVIKERRVLDAGSHKATTREDWWYPKYVEKFCPGLPDWTALKSCGSIFSPDRNGRGEFIAGPWDKPDQIRIRALGLDLRVRKVKDSDALWLELDKAYKARRPILLFNWTPNWVEAKYQGSFVEFPDWAPECESQSSWGISKKYPYDCGNPKNGWLKKAVWIGVASQWPCAFKILQNINFTNKMLAEIVVHVDVDKLSYQQAADQWVKNNTAIWQGWVATGCTADNL